MNVTERRVVDCEERGEANGELGRVGGNIERPVDFFEVRLRDGSKITIVVYKLGYIKTMQYQCQSL